MLPSIAKPRPTQSPPLSRGGFSLIELLVVVAILVILCSIFVPYVGKMRETNRRVGCANNLRQIHVAFREYTDNHYLAFPSMPWDPSAPGRYVAFTGAESVPETPRPATSPAPAATVPAETPGTGPAAPGPPPVMPAEPATLSATTPTAPATQAFGPGTRNTDHGVRRNDVTAPLWLLVRLGYVQPQAFICASSSQTLDPMLTGGKRALPSQRSNFTSGQHLSYSYCSPYSAAPEYRLNSDLLPPDFAIMADKNPGVDVKGSNAVGPAYDAPPLRLAAANSRNHDRAGQNVLYVTGEVRFQSTPYCGYGDGWKRDNIYSAFAARPLPPSANPSPEAKGFISQEVGPAWKNDSYLVPTDGE